LVKKHFYIILVFIVPTRLNLWNIAAMFGSR